MQSMQWWRERKVYKEGFLAPVSLFLLMKNLLQSHFQDVNLSLDFWLLIGHNHEAFSDDCDDTCWIDR